MNYLNCCTMLKPSKEQIKEMGEDLDCGFICYFNIKNGSILNIPDFDNWGGENRGTWHKEIKEVNANREDYMEIEGFDSHKSFRIMENFAISVDNADLQDALIRALNKSKPFRNFKWVIDGSGEYRQQWFDYKKAQYIEWIEGQIEAYEDYYEEYNQ
jgi:hypothetical protein